MVWGDVYQGRSWGLLKDMVENKTDIIVGANYWTEANGMVLTICRYYEKDS